VHYLKCLFGLMLMLSGIHDASNSRRRIRFLESDLPVSRFGEQRSVSRWLTQVLVEATKH
ncbi:hypothetical protein VDR08_16830, partial [Xanthomonas campestris pv. campestris]|nr:hypothetical protein [Xanthomonas campestris pv. campestris]